MDLESYRTRKECAESWVNGVGLVSALITLAVLILGVFATSDLTSESTKTKLSLASAILGGINGFVVAIGKFFVEQSKTYTAKLAAATVTVNAKEAAVTRAGPGVAAPDITVAELQQVGFNYIASL